MNPIAALPMYDFPELREATDAFWAAIVARLDQAGIPAPTALLRGPAIDDVWAHPALLLAQTCGYPLVTTLKERVCLVATPCYSAPGCEGAFYRSAIVVRADDPAANLAALRGRRCAVNEAGSNSGMNLLRAVIAPLAAGATRFFGSVTLTGAHAASIRAVAGGQADVAAIDCVTWAHMQHLRPAETRRLRVLEWTAATPCLPLITSMRTDQATLHALRQALADIAADPELTAVKAALRLAGFALLTRGDYDAILDLERQAQQAGYQALR